MAPVSVWDIITAALMCKKHFTVVAGTDVVSFTTVKCVL